MKKKILISAFQQQELTRKKEKELIKRKDEIEKFMNESKVQVKLTTRLNLRLLIMTIKKKQTE